MNFIKTHLQLNVFYEKVDSRRSMILISLLNRDFKTIIDNKFIY